MFYYEPKTVYVMPGRGSCKTSMQLEIYEELLKQDYRVELAKPSTSKPSYDLLDYDILTYPELERANRILDELLKKKQDSNLA